MPQICPDVSHRDGFAWLLDAKDIAADRRWRDGSLEDFRDKRSNVDWCKKPSQKAAIGTTVFNNRAGSPRTSVRGGIGAVV